MNWLDGLPFIAQLGITTATILAAVWAAFTFLGRKWIDERFAQSLERFKHDHQQEIERLRFRINALMDRTAKLHQHEFTVLPQLWDKLTTDFGETIRFTSRLQSLPDLERLERDELDEFIASVPLRSSERERLHRATPSERNEVGHKMLFWHQAAAARKAHTEFHNYFIANAIFIQPELKEQIRSVSNLIYDAFTEREVEERLPNLREGRFAAGDRLHAEGPGLQRQIEQAVQSRLWDTNKLE